jgi:hypothetical protein
MSPGLQGLISRSVSCLGVESAARSVCVGLAVLCLGVAFAVAPAPAATRYVDGISDQSIPAWDGGFTGGYFAEYFSSNWIVDGHIREARYVVQWDVMSEPSRGPDASGDYRERFEAWYRDAASLGLTLDVSLTAYAGGLPSPGEYRLQLGRLLHAFDSIRYLEAWNEPNFTLGLSPSLADEYTNSASALCAAQGTCTVIAGNLLDDAGMVGYERRYLGGLVPLPRLWGVHPYHAVSDHSETAILAFVKTLPGEGAGEQIWFTEVGAYACRRSAPGGEAAQAQDAAWLTGELMPTVKPAHVFYYEFLYKERRPPPCDSAEADTALYLPSDDPNVPDAPRAAASFIFANTATMDGAPLVLLEGQLADW